MKFVGFAALPSIFLMACGGGDGTECGPGTTAADGVCVPSGSDLQCGEGTFEHNGECVAYDPSDGDAPAVSVEPPGGPTRALPLFVMLTTDEPATIYYTTDGSEPTQSSAHDTSPTIVTGIEDGTELRYFAVDPTGNAAPVKSAVYDLDVAGPAAVSALAAVPKPGQIELSWLAPDDADYAGVVVVRSAGRVPSFLPEDGSFYAAGDQPVAGEEVVFAGQGTAVVDPQTTPGAYFYSAWSYDQLGNYSPLRMSRALRPLGAQSGSLAIDLASGAVTPTQPTNLNLSATAVYDDADDQVTVDITVRNDSKRLLFNLKGRLGASQGAAQAPSFAGVPYLSFGPAALDVGVSVTRQLVVAGVTDPAEPLVLTLDFANHRSLVGGRSDLSLVDLSGTNLGYQIDSERPRQGAVSVDGQFIYVGSKRSGKLAIFDTRAAAGEAPPALATPDLAHGSTASIGGVAVSLRHNAVYVGVNDGVHWHGGGGDGNRGSPSRVDLVWLHGGTLAELGRITLRADDPDSRTVRSVQLSPDGTRAAVALTSTWSQLSELWLVDLDSFTVIDADAATDGAQPIAVAGTGWIEQVLWSEDSATVYVGFNTHRDELGVPATVAAVDVATGEATPITLLGDGEGVGAMAVHDGKLYVPTRRGGGGILTVVDLASGDATEIDDGFTDAHGVVFHPGSDTAYVASFQSVAIVDATSGTRVDADQDATNGVTSMLAPDSFGPHFMAVTPF